MFKLNYILIKVSPQPEPIAESHKFSYAPMDLCTPIKARTLRNKYKNMLILLHMLKKLDCIINQKISSGPENS